MSGAACTAIKGDGSPCSMPAEVGKDTCRYHDPLRAAASDMGKRSVQARREKREEQAKQSVTARDDKPDLRTTEGCQRELERILLALDAGNQDTVARARVQVVVVQAAHAIIHSDTKKLHEELEALLEERPDLKRALREVVTQ